MAPPIEVIKAVNELINAQADQLWTISISVIVGEILIIAHLVRKQSVTLRPKIVAGVIGVSALCHVFALTAGYLSKGALIQAMINLAKKDGIWTFPNDAKLFNLLQVTFVTIGLIIFIVCFFYYSSELANAMIKKGGGK